MTTIRISPDCSRKRQVNPPRNFAETLNSPSFALDMIFHCSQYWHNFALKKSNETSSSKNLQLVISATVYSDAGVIRSIGGDRRERRGMGMGAHFDWHCKRDICRVASLAALSLALESPILATDRAQSEIHDDIPRSKRCVGDGSDCTLVSN